MLDLLIAALRSGRSIHEHGGRTTRERIHDLVAQRPGLPVGEITRRLALSPGTMYYHLFRLVRDGDIATQVIGRRRLVFPSKVGRADPIPLEALALVRGQTMRRVARAIVDAPGASVGELADRSGDSPRSVYYHIKQLRDAGLVTTSTARRYRGIAPTSALTRAMDVLDEADEA